MTSCPYCGLEDPAEDLPADAPLPEQGDLMICEGCGLVEIATGVLLETRFPIEQEAADLQQLFENLPQPANPLGQSQRRPLD
jgi:hypothetical protein